MIIRNPPNPINSKMLTFDGYMQKKSCAILILEKLLFKTLLTFELWCFYQNSKRRKRMVGTYKIAECLKWLTKYIFLHKNINSRRKEVRHYSNWMQANLSKFAIYLFYQFKEKNYWRILLKTNLSSHHLRYIDISHVFFFYR